MEAVLAFLGSGLATAGLAPALAFFGAALATAGLALLVPRPARRRAGREAHLVALLARLGGPLRRGIARRPPHDLAARIAAAGSPAGLGPRELMAAKVSAALAAGGAGTVASSLAPGRLGPLVVLAAPVAGFMGPDLWLRRRARERAARARRELPAMLDLLRVTVEAGTPLAAALGAVGARASGPLAMEWRAASTEVELGVPLAEALAGMAGRLPLPEVQALVAALERARRHGAPLADTLSAQARDARFALRRHVQEQAARAGPKIQLVVALLLVPSVLLLVAAALAAALLDSGGEIVPV
jgi:tight adherence protein C